MPYLFKNNFIFMSLFFLVSLAALGCPLTADEVKSGGRCVSVNGYELYLHESGKNSPTIIFESGLGDSSCIWDKVTPQVEKFAHTIIYDRPGFGRSRSNVSETERTAQQAVNTLRALLQKSSIHPPYILVGHSLGGLYMQLFAQEYPSEVSAVVLVDSATRDQDIPPFPSKDANYYSEAIGMKKSIEQVQNAPAFPNIPLVILTTSQRGEAWLRLQKNLLKLSTKSSQRITPESGHFIQREQPELVINTLEELVKKN